MTPMQAAGVAFIAPLGRVLFLKRSGLGDHAGEWCLPGGGVETGETTEQAARREILEETKGESFLEAGPLKEIARLTSDEGVDFTTFGQEVVEEFEPTLNGEHDAFVWADAKNLPKPLHPGVQAVLSNDEMRTQLATLAQDHAGFVPGVTLLGGFEKVALAIDTKQIKLAMDRAPDSVRDKSRDGHLHVSKAHISKAAVNPYVGREIPRWKELGLDPDKVYQLLRDPEEMAKAVSTFNRLPILKKHVPVTSKKHPHELVVGSLGSDASYDDDYLDNSLAVWEEDSIADVESDRKRQLSSAYHYDADMTPGNFRGTRFDGIMRNIVGNHVALVSEGRAGDDVVVGDSKGNLQMATKKIVLSRMGALAVGALMSYLGPKMAQDAKIDLVPLFKGVTKKNFKDKSAGLVAELTKATKDLLAQDASIEDLGQLLDTLSTVDVAEAKDADPMAATLTTAPAAETADSALDADPVAKIMEFLKDKLSPEDMAALEALTAGDVAGDEADEDDDKNNDGKKDKAPPFVAKDKDMITKPAMDAALKKNSETVKSEMRAENAAFNSALKAVKPYVGEIAIALDSADAVYEHALKALNVDLTDVHPSAYPAILRHVPLPGAKQASRSPRIAMDAKAAKGFASRFEDASKISIG